jgi:hypothetical protein
MKKYLALAVMFGLAASLVCLAADWPQYLEMRSRLKKE